MRTRVSVTGGGAAATSAMYADAKQLLISSFFHFLLIYFNRFRRGQESLSRINIFHIYTVYIYFIFFVNVY